MAKNVQLLLIENVESLGIVGDVVNVRVGYARNFLLPRALATQPDEKLIKQLAGKRADAEKQMAQLRKDREGLTDKLKGVDVEMIRACNDQGILYGAVTQQDIASALGTKGFKISPRDVRITGAIKRVDNFDVHIKLDKDLDAVIKLHVKPDRELPKDRGPAGAGAEEVVSAGAGPGDGPKKRDALSMALEEANKGVTTGWAAKAAGADVSAEGKGAKGDSKKGKGEKPAKADKADGAKEAKAEKPAKEDKPAKAEKADKGKK